MNILQTIEFLFAKQFIISENNDEDDYLICNYY
jgi:hypothetical protein